MFLDFANIYKIFIRNVSRIAAPLTLILQTSGNNELSSQTTKDELNHNASATNGNVGGQDVKNLSTGKLAKGKKPNLAKSKNAKKLDFVTAQISRTDFFIPEVKKVFIHLHKAFTEVTILWYFDPGRHICIETDTSKYAIGGVLKSDNFKSTFF